MMPSPTPMIKNTITEGVRNTFTPINEWLFKHLYLIVVIVLLFVLFYCIKKVCSYFVYKKYKNKVRKTNKWFNWEEYARVFADYKEREHAKKEQIFAERLQRREQNRNPKKNLQNN